MAHGGGGKSIKQGEAPTLADRLMGPFQRFGRLEAAGGILLLVMAAIAMIWANSPWGHSYHYLWHELKVSISAAEYDAGHDPATDTPSGGSPAAPMSQPGGEASPTHGATPDPTSPPDEAEGAMHLDPAGHAAEPASHAHASNESEKVADVSMSIGHWINDLVMAIFFLLVGLEIKREVVEGELSSPKKAALPVAAALGGMLVPAAIYAAIHWGQPLTIRGWGVPMATDIAFALGVLALLGRRVPEGVRLFLTTLAIADDLGALLVIAIFYTENLDLVSLGIAAIIWAALIVMGMAGFRSITLYMAVGLVLWWFVFHSGIHATIAGVMLALAIPCRPRINARKYLAFTREALDEFEKNVPKTDKGEFKQTTADQQEMVQAVENASVITGSPLHRLEYILAPWVAFAIIPVFALANSGVAIGGSPANATDTVEVEAKIGLAVALGLCFGKPIGVFLFSFLAVKLGLGALPRGVRWGHIHGAGWLAGIGFTMALFIANLAFRGHPLLLDGAKLGILGGSAVAGVIGLIVLVIEGRKSPPSTSGRNVIAGYSN
ncbi:MAG: Na+/H+ antiporter NhaA [Phycisphaerales bacterium]|nr:Na+/H+ antiporter NhaA [Phycisphaerales bacterium]MCB9841255.1 Na+/H+ antiporter NhaA [Phycisphaeraceae bacterium]